MTDFFAVAVQQLRREFQGPPVDAAAPHRPGPRQCCAEFAIVTACDGDTDSCWCGICGRTWRQPCSVGDFVPAIEAAR